MTKIFFVPGIPEPQARPRLGRGHVYSPKTAWWQTVFFAARQHRPRPAYDCPLLVVLRFYMPRPQDISAGVFWAFRKPDSDNLAKAVLDAMTQADYWEDDALVVALTVEKIYIRKGERSGVHVSVEELAP